MSLSYVTVACTEKHQLFDFFAVAWFPLCNLFEKGGEGELSTQSAVEVFEPDSHVLPDLNGSIQVDNKKKWPSPEVARFILWYSTEVAPDSSTLDVFRISLKLSMELRLCDEGAIGAAFFPSSGAGWFKVKLATLQP